MKVFTAGENTDVIALKMTVSFCTQILAVAERKV
jgi:hypothetical protein